ncbi:MAG: YggT family protein [Candidatus Dormiibacterota bacterium]
MREMPPDDHRRRAAQWYRVIALIWFVAAVIDVLIAARFLGLLFGASPASPFVSLIYGVTAPLVAPFEGIFGTPAAGAHVFETADLVAIVVYLLIAVGLVALVRILSGRRRPDVT